MQIQVLSDIHNYTIGEVVNLVAWKSENDHSIYGKTTGNGDLLHFPRGTYKRLNVFVSSVTVDVGELGLPEDLYDDLVCYLEANNDTIHKWRVSNTYFPRTNEINEYLREVGVPMDADINFKISW